MDFNGTLNNGVELYTCLNPALRGFCLSLWIRRGSMHEPGDAHGLVHFLEHAVFRSISERMGGRLYAQLTARGLCFDASTFVNYVRFEMSGPAEAFQAGLDILMMALDPPALTLEGLNMERRRIKTEIREEDAAESSDAFANSMVWRGTQLARNIAGTAHSVNLIGLDSLRAEYARWFSRGNFFFCATGHVPDVPALLARVGGIAPGSAAPVVEAAPVPPGFFRRDARVIVQDRGYTWLRFCFDVDTSRHSEAAFMNLEEYLLGDVGRLYLALSEDTALVYDLNDDFERYANIGNLSFEFEVEPRRAGEAIDCVVAALNGAKEAGDDALEAAKQCGIYGDWLKEQAVCTFNNIWGFDNGIRHGGFRSAEQRLEAYRAVTPEEMRQIAREAFRPENAVLCARGSRRRFDADGARQRLLRLA